MVEACSQLCRNLIAYHVLMQACIHIKKKHNLDHYQKLDKYKWKYRGNIFIGKFSRTFIDGNIPLIYTDGITVGNFFKTKQRKKR